MNYRLNTSAASAASASRLDGAGAAAAADAGRGRQASSIAFAAILISSAVDAGLAADHRPHRRHATSRTATTTAFSCGAPILLGVYLVGLVSTLHPDAHHGRRRPPHPVQPAQRALHQAAGAAGRVLQPEPAGDLISRINNDTDKLNQFFAQALMQFLGNAVPDRRRGHPAAGAQHPSSAARRCCRRVLVLIVTQLIGGWVKRANFKSLQTLGGLSGEIQESLANFKVIVAFNRLDYFRNKFAEANAANYAASIRAGIASNIFIPLYGLAYNLGAARRAGLRHLADRAPASSPPACSSASCSTSTISTIRCASSRAIWSSLQLALAGARPHLRSAGAAAPTWRSLPPRRRRRPMRVLAFDDVSFAYPEGARRAQVGVASRSSAARPTRWSARPAAARPPRPR